MTAVLFLPRRSGAAAAKGISNLRWVGGGRIQEEGLHGLCWRSSFVFFQIYDLCGELAGARVITAYALIYTSLLIIWGGSAACWCQYIPPRLGPGGREEPFTLPLRLSLSLSLSACGTGLKLGSTATLAASRSFPERRRQMSLTLPLTAGCKKQILWKYVLDVATTTYTFGFTVPLPLLTHSTFFPLSPLLWNYIGQVSFQQQATHLAALFSILFISAALDLKNLLGPPLGS